MFKKVPVLSSKLPGTFWVGMLFDVPFAMSLSLSTLIKGLDFILPSICITCEQPSYERNLCSSCIETIPFIKPPFCFQCGIPLSSSPLEKKILCGKCFNQKSFIRKNRSCALYDGLWKEILHLYKFNQQILLAREFAILSSEHFLDLNFQEYDYLIPVPLDTARFKERKFNQAQLLAEKLALFYNKKVCSNILFKRKTISPQSSLSRKERILNIKGAFSITHKEWIKNKKILLIDDVKTTGATLHECAKTLSKAKPKFIDSFTLALTPP